MNNESVKKVVARIKKRVTVKAELILLTPLIIGSGEKGPETDILIVKDENGFPYIPATSFVGALRHWFEEKIDFGNKEHSEYFWGSKETGVQSAFIVDDLYIVEEKSGTAYPKILARDGVKIHPQKGTAEDKEKFSYELATPGTKLVLSFEVIFREGYEEDKFNRIISTILDGLTNDRIRFGAMTNKGFGKIKLKNLVIELFDYSSEADVISWLFDGEGRRKQIKDFGEPYPLKENYLEITGDFVLQDSIIIRSYSTNINDPDSVHLQSFDENCNIISILSGTSIKGVLRHRMEKILSTFGVNPSGNEQVKKFMGHVDEKNRKNAYRSSLMVDESVIINPIRKVQRRIKIDRFTGGTVDGALFDEEPVWSDPLQKETYVTLRIKLEGLTKSDWRAGLLLLALKDLWNEDLPIGGESGIGRGLLRGRNIKVKDKSGEIASIENATGELKITGDKERLEEYVKGFMNFVGGGVNNE